MKTTELIEFLGTHPFTKDQAYNLIVNDLFEFVPQEAIESEGGQRLIAYFMYKIQEVCLPAIERAKASTAATA